MTDFAAKPWLERPDAPIDNDDTKVWEEPPPPLVPKDGTVVTVHTGERITPQQVVWYVPDVPYVVLVPDANRPNDMSACRVHGPYGWQEAGRVADRLMGYARAVVWQDEP